MSEEKRPAVTEEVKEARKLTEEELAKVNGSGADNSNKMQVGLRFVILKKLYRESSDQILGALFYYALEALRSRSVFIRITLRFMLIKCCAL